MSTWDRRSGIRIHTVEKHLGELATGTYYREIIVPAARLMCEVAIFFDRVRLSNTGQIAAISAFGENSLRGIIAAAGNTATLVGGKNPTSSAQSLSTSLITGLEAGLLHTLIDTDNDLPMSYDVETGMERVLAVISITKPQINAADIFPNWIIRATYEPRGHAAIDDDELEKLFGRCDIR